MGTEVKTTSGENSTRAHSRINEPLRGEFRQRAILAAGDSGGNPMAREMCDKFYNPLLDDMLRARFHRAGADG